MDRREARRRARWAVALLVDSALDEEFDVGWGLTDKETQEEFDMITAAMRDVARSLLRTLPAGWEPPAIRPVPRDDEWES